MPTKKRHPRNADLGGLIRDRLEELRQEKGLNYTAFARAAGVPRPQYNGWRNDGRVPGGFYLRQLATKLEVTASWLLAIPGAPKYPNQTRADAALSADLEGYLARSIAERLANRWAHVRAGMFVVNVDATLRLGIDAVVARLTANCESIELFYRRGLDAPTRWSAVLQRLADHGASLKTRHERHKFAAELLELTLVDAARRVDELFQDSPVRIVTAQLEEFLGPFEEQGRERLARRALKLSGADSRIFLAMIATTRSKSSRAGDRSPVGRPTQS
jgi:transcriptional regulator with XRE-family HTH domain